MTSSPFPIRPSLTRSCDPATRASSSGRRAAPLRTLAALGGCLMLLGTGTARADALAAPGFSGSLAANPDPLSVNAGPFGALAISGQISGLGMLQSHRVHVPGSGNSDALADISNAQVEIQNTDGPVQIYVQAGAYALPSLGSAYLRASKTVDEFYGPVPVAYAKGVISPELSVMGGALPTLIGAESTFTFQNVNIERGLLWNQEPAVSRGFQANYADGPVSAAFSLNDGYYSGKLNWLSGMLSYTLDPSNSISVVGGGSLSRNDRSSTTTPLAQNNGGMVNLIYTYGDGPLTLTPYVQYGHVGRDDMLGINRSADTYGGALLVKYQVSEEWSLGSRAEYLKSSGGGCDSDRACAPTNLLYGPDSGAWSLTITPTYQKGVFFARGELSYTRINRLGAGSGFGRDQDSRDQVRGLIETGILF